MPADMLAVIASVASCIISIAHGGEAEPDLLPQTSSRGGSELEDPGGGRGP